MVGRKAPMLWYRITAERLLLLSPQLFAFVSMELAMCGARRSATVKCRK
jgi:hypothetical protein